MSAFETSSAINHQTTESAEAAQRPAEPKPKRRRGFAVMDPKLVSEISRKGGKAAHTAGTAHEFTTEEAREAGRKGGRATHAKRRARAEQGTPVSETVAVAKPVGDTASEAKPEDATEANEPAESTER